MASNIKKILQGDQQEILKFYQEYSPKISRYLLKNLPNSEVEEVLNDTFLDAIDALPSLKIHSNLNAWLYKIAHHKMVDFYRKKKIRSLLFSHLPYVEFVAQEINEPEFQFEKNKLRDKIEDAFHQLSLPYQQILKLHYEEQIPVRDLALRLNLSFKATESLLFRARKRFQQTYERI